MESSNPSIALKTLKTIHFSLLAGPVLFLIYTLSEIYNSSGLQLIDTTNILSYFPIGLAAVIIPVSYYLVNSILKQSLIDKTELSQKIAAFQTTHIVKIAILEGVALFTIVASNSTFTYGSLIAFVFLLGVMLMSTPSVFKLAESLELTQEETSLLQN